MKFCPFLALVAVVAASLAAAACSGAAQTGGDGTMPGGEQPAATATNAPSVAQPQGQTPYPILTAAPTATQLLVSPADIQQSADGKYFVPDRGDGCYYVEVWRAELEAQLRVGLQAPDCSELAQLVWEFAPDTGELRPVLPRHGPPERWHGGLRPSPADFQQRADGTYSLPDTGDGCSYEEIARYTNSDQEQVLLQASNCQPGLLLALNTWDMRFVLVYRPPDLSPPTTPALRWPEPFPRAEEIQIGPDGKYFIRGRADGCDYDEQERNMIQAEGRLWVLLQSPECSPLELEVPGHLGGSEVIAAPTPPPPIIPGVAIADSPDLQEIYRDAGGKYFIPDRGDRCVWTEQQRLTLVPLRAEQHVVVYLYSEECHPAFYFRYDVADLVVTHTERLGPEGQPLPAILWPLPVTLEDIQQDEAGKYAVPARADGCAYDERGRPVIDGKTWVMLGAPACYVLWRYAPATGELMAMQNDWWPIHEAPDVSDIQQQLDGTYMVVDRGDGCPWTESFRAWLGEGTRRHLMVYFTSGCSNSDWEVPAYQRVAYDATADELVFLPPW